MTTTSYPLLLSDGGSLRVRIYDPESNIQEDYNGDYIKANMENGTHPSCSFYIVYDKVNYGLDHGDVTKSVCVPSDPLSGSSNTVDLPFPAKSAQGFDCIRGIVLFQYKGYVGNSQFFHTSCGDTTIYFPTGIRSAIVIGNVRGWWTYGSKNFVPPALRFFRPGYYPSADFEGVKSIAVIIQ